VIALAAARAGEGWLAPQVAMHNADDVVTPAEAAELVGLSPRTIYGWIATGRLAHSLSAQGRYRVRVHDVLEAMALAH